MGRGIPDDVGSNVPVTRTPDAHWMAEVRYRGTKVVSVSPDYADNTKFADEWMPCAAGTDGAWRWRWVTSSSRSASCATGFRSSSTTCGSTPICRSWSSSRNATACWCPEEPHRRRPRPMENAGVQAGAARRGDRHVAVPKGSLGFRYGDDGVGKWNLDLGDLVPALTVAGPDGETAVVHLPRFDTVDGHGEDLGGVCRYGRSATPRLHGVRPDAGPVRGGPAGLPGTGPPATTTPPSRTPWPRSRSPECRRHRRSTPERAQRRGVRRRSMIIMGAGIASGSTATPPTARCWRCCC